MKRVFSLITAFALCLAMVLSCASAEEFVPSIGDKDHPELVPGENGSLGEIIDSDGKVIDTVDEGCLVITPVSEAETSDEIPEDAKDELLYVYRSLANGSMQLPYESVDASIDPSEMVIRDLFDISFLCEEHPEMLNDGALLRLTFDLGVSANEEVIAMVYVDGQWLPVTLTNNGDGTVTCIFTKICAVAFSVRQGTTPPQTGDSGGKNIVLWSSIMLLCAVALVVSIVIYRKKIARHD